MENLFFAHVYPTDVKGRGRGRKERVYDVSKNPGSYAYVCKFHHADLDETRKAIANGHNILGLPSIFLKVENIE